MQLTSCPHCGVVYDLDALAIGDMNNTYVVDGETWYQCRLCYKRIRVKLDVLKFHENCKYCADMLTSYLEGSNTADELRSLLKKHLELPIVPIENHVPSPYTTEEVEKMSGSCMPHSCRDKGDCGCD